MSLTTTTHRATVRLAENFQFNASFPDLPGAPTLRFDEPPPLGEGTAPQAVDVVSAAIGNCLAASFAFCLRKARVEFSGLEAHVTTDVTRDERGRMRIRKISVELVPELTGDNPAAVERCTQLFEDFCTVTASVRRGIEVGVAVKQPALQPA
jgi:uncharacterized OsmC-like protein